MRSNGPPSNEDIAELCAECRFDPWKYCGLAWDWGYGALKKFTGPREWQDDILEVITEHLKNPKTRFTLLEIARASGHGVGKSALIGMLSNWAMSCFANARVVITANTAKQLTQKTSPESAKWFLSSITAHWFDVQAEAIKMKGSNGWRTDFATWSAHNTEAFQGLHNMGSIILIMFDEASGIDDKVWEVTQGALTDEDTVLIWIVFGNPTQASGKFRECFRRFAHRWNHGHIDSRDVEGTNKEYFARLIEDYGVDSDFVKVRVRGMFPSSSVRQFIQTSFVDDAQKQDLRRSDYEHAPVIIGVDPAWTGEDTLEVYMRQGLYCKHLLTLAKNDNDIEVAQTIMRLQDKHDAEFVFVDQGYGTGIYSYGKQMGRQNWHLIAFGGKSARVDCINKRVEMWWKMREWLKEGGAIDPKDTILYEDLISPEGVERPDGQYQLESKKDMKDRGARSPNRGDALALTFAMDVVGRRANRAKQEADSGRGDFAVMDYNIFGSLGRR